MRRASFQPLGTTIVGGVIVVLFAALLGPSRLAAEDGESVGKAVRPSKLDLSPASLSSLLALGRPHDSEWRHLRVEWLTDVVAVRRKAAAENKPIVICYTGGAGYNEPLGVC